jgi:antitoxin VapB
LEQLRVGCLQGQLLFAFNDKWLAMELRPMTTKQKLRRDATEAKLFWNGRSQAVRLPKAFRFEGDSVQIRRVPGGVLLEEKPKVKETEESIMAWFAKLDAIGADPLFPEGRKQEMAPIREYFE